VVVGMWLKSRASMYSITVAIGTVLGLMLSDLPAVLQPTLCEELAL
jgi:putative Ca2+/H+ antiporter (TMEM165/GDT1 family)